MKGGGWKKGPTANGDTADQGMASGGNEEISNRLNNLEKARGPPHLLLHLRHLLLHFLHLLLHFLVLILHQLYLLQVLESVQEKEDAITNVMENVLEKVPANNEESQIINRYVFKSANIYFINLLL